MHHKNYIVTILIAIVVLSNAACKKSDTPSLTEEQIQIALLAKSWSPVEGSFVTQDNQDVSINFQGFNLVFNTSKSYTSTNGNSPIWSEAGTYEFEVINGVKNLNRLIRSDGTEVRITDVTESILRIEFYYDPDNTGGRTKGIQGRYVFNLVNN